MEILRLIYQIIKGIIKMNESISTSRFWALWLIALLYVLPDVLKLFF